MNLESDVLKIVKVQNGTNGNNGVGISSTIITYGVSSSDTIEPSSYNPTFPSNIQQGQWIWTKTIINYTDATSKTTYSKTYIGQDGSQGQPGTPGVGISSTVIKYGKSNSENTEPTNWYDNTSQITPAPVQGDWLWVRTVINYTNGNSSTSYSKSYIGTDGQDGTSVSIQSTSKTGKTTTIIINNGDGTTQTLTIDDGEDGENGVPGANGYVHIAWANSADGSQDFSTSVSANKEYIGVYTDNIEQDSQHYYDYSWSLIKGADGTDGKGIVSIVEYYARNNNKDSAPNTGWSTNILTPTVDQQYVWNYETINYSVGNPTNTDKHIVAMYGAVGADGRGIQSIVDKYATSNSTTAPLDSSFNTTMPSDWGPNEKYLWNMETITYTDGNSSNSSKRIISIYAVDGTSVTITGTSTSGGVTTVTFSDGTSIQISDGKEISTITEYYAISNSSTTAPSTGWNTTLQTPTSANPYLWNYERITYSNNTTTDTSKRIIGTFSKGITSITNYYAATNNTTAPEIGSLSWKKCPPNPIPALDSTNKYLWNYEHTDYNDGTSGNTTAHIISMYAQDGAVVTVTNTTITYYQSDNGTTTPTSGWQPNPPAAIAGQYMWTKTVITYSDNSSSTTYSVSKNGTNGTNGVSITGVVEEYAINNSSTTAPTTNWSTSQIAPTSSNKYLWNREVISYSSGNPTTTTPHIAGMYSADGKGISSIVNTYAINNDGTTAPATGWDETPMAPTSSNKYLWNKEVVNYTTGNPTTTTRVIGTFSEDGYNQATIYLYKRSPTTITIAPTATKYTFSSGTLTGATAGWTRYIPPSENDSNPCYVSSAVAISRTDEDTTLTFNIPTLLVKNGEDGDPGNNYIILYYYKRTTDATVPTPSGNYTYNFNTNTISSEPQGWYTSFPTGDDPCWVTAISFYGTGTTVSGTFTTPVKLVENGEDAGQYQIQSSQQRFLRYLSKNANEEQLLYEISPSTLKFSVKNLKTNTLEVFTENEMDIKLINSFLSEGQTYKSEYSIKTVLGNPNNAYWEYDNNNNITACFLKIDALYNYSQQEVANNVSDDVKGLHDALQAFFNQLQGNICISIGNNTYKAEKYFAIQNGLTDEMIEFQINARNIQAAIDNKKLVFDDNGLTIDNGGFVIRQSNDQGGYNRIFYIDPEQKQIWMQGSGTFTGTITANEGQIGGFSIGEYSITSNGLELYSEHSENGQTIESKIFAQNLEIGTGANIQNYLQIGNLKLLNPELNDNYVMKLENNGVTKFSLTNDGNGYFNGTINATDGSFSGEIVASVINASTINTANFVSEETRTMGGSFIYKPAFEVVKIEEGGSGSTVKTKKIKITLTSNAKAYAISNELGKDRIISLSGNGICYGKLVDDENWIEDTIHEEFTIYGEFTTDDHNIILNQTEIYNTITFYGYGNDTSLLIGINSDNARVGNIMPPRALVMESFSNLNIPETSGSGTITYNTKLLLGDLSSINSIVGDNAGYGLYSDNVYLKGSLTTTGGNNNYAGVNTRGPIDFNYGLWDTGTSDTSKYSDHKIIFWGGANNTTDSNIQSSKFIVTDKGSIFATSGEFKGSVISDSVISKSVIQAAIIEGTGTSPSLKIYDTGSNGGIGFYKKVSNIDGIDNNEDNDELTLSIDTTGLTYLADKKFIEFNTNEVIATLGRANFGELQINDQGINSNDENIKIKLNNNDKITINANGVTNTGNYITNEGTTIFTSNNKTLKYTVKDGYYVLYVEEVNAQS